MYTEKRLRRMSPQHRRPKEVQDVICANDSQLVRKASSKPESFGGLVGRHSRDPPRGRSREHPRGLAQRGSILRTVATHSATSIGMGGVSFWVSGHFRSRTRSYVECR